MAKEIKKIVLAYSGGLDTSIIIPWLHENYPGCEVICVAGNVGQDSEIVGLEERAKKTGASKLYIEDIQDEFVNDPQGWRKVRRLSARYFLRSSSYRKAYRGDCTQGRR